MSRYRTLERLVVLQRLLGAARRAVSMDELMWRLGASRATVKRDLAFVRDRLGWPLAFNRDLGGYVLGRLR